MFRQVTEKDATGTALTKTAADVSCVKGKTCRCLLVFGQRSLEQHFDLFLVTAAQGAGYGKKVDQSILCAVQCQSTVFGQCIVLFFLDHIQNVHRSSLLLSESRRFAVRHCPLYLINGASVLL